MTHLALWVTRRLVALSVGVLVWALAVISPAIALDASIFVGVTSEWTDPNNWTNAVPTGANAIATFEDGAANTTVTNAGGSVTVGEILFKAQPNAAAYTFNIVNNFTLNAAGVINDSTNSQLFNVAAAQTLSFVNGAFAGNSVSYVNNGTVVFNNTSSAGAETFLVNPVGAVFTNNAPGALIKFNDNSTAGIATIMNTVGSVVFTGNSNGGDASLINGAAGTIDFSGSTGPSGNNHLGVGSLSGSGTFIVGQTQLVTVANSLAFTSGALYLLRASGANAGEISVNGTATLAGNVEVGVVGSAQANHSFDILHATGGLGGTTFSGAQVLAPGLTAVLSYSATDVFLNLTANLGSGGGLGGNQKNIANSINGAFNNGGALPPGFMNLFGLSGNALSNALTQISGETATGSQQTTFDAMGQFMGLLTDPFMNRSGGVGSSLSSGYTDENAYTAKSNPTDAFAMFTKAQPQTFTQRWSVWAAGFGGSQNTSGNAVVGSNNATSSIGGTAVGADYLLSPNTLLGFALAGGGTSFNVANGGTGRSDLFQAGAYIRHNEGPAYISAALAYGWQDITTNRTVTVAGFDQLRAQFDANAWSGRVEGGYRFVSPATLGIGITPYAAAQFVTFDLPSYAEQAVIGTNTFALNYGAHDVTDPRSELGIRTDESFVMPDGVLTLRGRFAWAHDYDPNRSIGATFQSLPGASFVVNGAAQAADSALTTASIEMKWRNGWSAAATFEGEFSNVTNSYAGKGVLRYQW